ncbi:DUF1064 domain-containing protein [Paraliobacillus ryukyuensis]|uniref:DUF1064 domain-containing protein n=1 Tax=Paraliobacillus ryukyuensis TaxID=200904 RepID=UPI0009A8F204|nr:DUF1064 domain-containing protein [Paraliobacillus ryukyuensis]
MIKQRRKSKYGNRKVEIDGHKFDSELEARYYQELKLLKKAGEIVDFSLQPRFELQPSFKKNGKTTRKITYIADFKIERHDGTIDIVDIKGHITKEFAIKRKLFDYQHDVQLKVLAWSKAKGWYEV